MRMIIAGGGTGGHVFPALAIAEELMGRSDANAVLFIGTDRGLEARVLPDTEYPFRTIDVAGITGKGLWGKITGVAKIPRSMMQSKSIIKEYRPDMVLGVGGYASGPAVITAWLMGIPTAVAEQNALPGTTNRILGRFVKKVFVAFEDNEKHFPPHKVLHTGNPVRGGFEKRTGTSAKGDKGVFTILVFGGSQGASRINRAFVESLAFLCVFQERLRIIHQTGDKEYEEIAGTYRDKGLIAEVHPFIGDMATAYARADLLVCRAGATSIAEITASGKAAIFIPYPHAAGDHQTCNARMMVDAGAAEMITEQDLSGERLAASIQRCINDRKRISRMEKASKALGSPDAARIIVDECIALTE